MTHPLTQLMVWKLVAKVTQTTDWDNCDDYEDVLYARAAADWQLEQVKEIVERKIEDMHRRGYDGGCRDLVYRADAIEEFFEDIMQEMRPQQQEDN